MDGQETARERFLRNHEDNINRMQAAVVRERRAGNIEKANEMQTIVNQWKGIADTADDSGE
jgi:hypothetical protein